MNGLQSFESTLEHTAKKTMPPSPKTITAAAMTTNRITSSRELLHYRPLPQFLESMKCQNDFFVCRKSALRLETAKLSW